MTLLDVQQLVKHFPQRGGLLGRIVGRVHAVNGVDLRIDRGEIVGVVGESGCGKSTLGKTLIRLLEPTRGSIVFDGQEITRIGHRQMMPLRRRMQCIFQDPYSALNPKMTAAAAIREVVQFHRVVSQRETRSYVDGLITRVGLRSDARDRYPHEFSGGQRQRINIARALAVRPDFLVADEPVSALDVSIQAQILNLLMDLKNDFSLTLLFISHDLKVVEHFCDRVLVMYLGQIVERIRCEDLVAGACHPYTRALLGAIPVADPAARSELTVLEGEVPSPREPPRGCPFAGRCPLVESRCHAEMPPMVARNATHQVACWSIRN